MSDLRVQCAFYEKGFLTATGSASLPRTSTVGPLHPLHVDMHLSKTLGNILFVEIGLLDASIDEACTVALMVFAKEGTNLAGWRVPELSWDEDPALPRECTSVRLKANKQDLLAQLLQSRPHIRNNHDTWRPVKVVHNRDLKSQTYSHNFEVDRTCYVSMIASK